MYPLPDKTIFTGNYNCALANSLHGISDLAWLVSVQINKRGDTVEEKIKKLDVELAKYKEQLKKTRPGPAQEAVKARAMRVLKQKRM